MQIPECCTYMRAELLEETVLLMLNKELMLRGNAMKQKENLSSFQQAGIRSLKKKLEEYRQEQKQIQTEKDGLYERYALKELGAEEYQRRAEALAERFVSLSVKETDAAQKLDELQNEYQKAEEDMRQIIRYSHIEELTQEVADTFIKKVYAYKDKRVEIEWNFSMDRGISQVKATWH